MALNDEIGNVPLFNESHARNGTIVWNEYTTHTEELCFDCELPIDYANGVYCGGIGCFRITHPQYGHLE